MATNNANRDSDQLKLAWFVSLIAAVLIILSFAGVEEQTIPDYGANRIDGHAPPAITPTTNPATTSRDGVPVR